MRLIVDADKSAFDYNNGLSSDPLELRDKARVEYHARWEAVEIVKAQELAAMTEERARQIMRMLRPFAPFPPDPSNGIGLVEQQSIFHRRKLWRSLWKTVNKL